MADLQLRIVGEDAASSAFNSVSSAARAAQQILIDFTKQSIKAYAESEAVQRQLQVVAKGLTGAFQQQATAMAQANNISDELVQQMQTMLLRYGEAPGAVKSTTQAILDYAAATGTDARSATELLTRGVEAGTGKFKGLGISIDATGSKTKDLAAATAELAKKYGGSSAADAESLTGQLRGAEEAFGDLQEVFGGFISDVGSKTGILKALTTELRNIAEGAQIAQRFIAAGGGKALWDSAKAIAFGTNEEAAASRVAVNRAAAQAMLPSVMAPVTDRMQEEALRRAKSPVRETDRASGFTVKSESENYKLKEGDFIDPTDAAEADFNKAILGSSDYVKGLNQRRLAVEDGEANLWKVVSDAADKGAAEAKAKAKQWADAGSAIGNAFAGSLSSAIESLAAGQSLDVGQTLGDILGSLLPALGGILGNLIAPGIGGAVGGILGQVGGAAARGLGRGGGVTIQAFDGQSTREFFEGNGGRALYDTTRTGRGSYGGR